MKEKDFQELLQAWVAGELNPDEASVFIQAAKNNKEEWNELLFSQGIGTVLKNKEMFEVGDILRNLSKEEGLPDIQNVPQKRIFKGFTLFVGVLLLSCMGIFAVGSYQGWWLSPEDRLVHTYLSPMENVIFTKDSREVFDQLRLGMDAYDKRNYEEAIPSLKWYFDQSADPNGALFLGVSYLMTDEPTNAIPLLRFAATRLEGILTEPAQWYLALALLKQHNYEEAIPLLQTLRTGSLYHTPSAEILEKIQ